MLIEMAGKFENEKLKWQMQILESDRWTGRQSRCKPQKFADTLTSYPRWIWRYWLLENGGDLGALLLRLG
jgi:hypothetical protein